MTDQAQPITSDGWILIDDASAKPILRGQQVKTHRGIVTVEGGRPPHKSSSTGRVWVRAEGSDTSRELFVTVIGAEWVRQKEGSS